MPLRRGDGTKRVVCSRSIEWTRSVNDHLLDDVLLASEEEIRDAILLLDHASQSALDPIVPVLEDLLELVKDHDAAFPTFLRDPARRRENILKGALRGSARRDLEPDHWLPTLVKGENGAKLGEEGSRCIEHLLRPRGHRLNKSTGGRSDERLLIVGRPEVNVRRKILALGQPAEG